MSLKELTCGCKLNDDEFTPCSDHPAAEVTTPTYLNPTTREVMSWQDAGLCMWCGGKCGSGSCRLRFCDSCTAYWIAGSEADYDEFDAGGQATVAPHKENCLPCVTWWANLHLENPPVGSFIHNINAG